MREPERCDHCRYSSPGARTNGALMFCRRHPPLNHSWPLVARDDWCGDFREKPVDRDLSGVPIDGP